MCNFKWLNFEYKQTMVHSTTHLLTINKSSFPSPSVTAAEFRESKTSYRTEIESISNFNKQLVGQLNWQAYFYFVLKC